VNERAIKFEEHYADGHYDRAPRLAAELVALKVDLVFADGGTPAVVAAMKATRSIPIVFSTVGDPLAQKIVRSLAHPGGNVTCLSMMSGETFAKKMALLKEAVPGITRVAFLVNSANPAGAYFLPIGRAAGQSLGIQLEPFDVRDFEDLDQAFEKMSRTGMQAVMVLNDIALNSKLKQLGTLALMHRLPMTAGEDEMGVLLTCNPGRSRVVSPSGGAGGQDPERSEPRRLAGRAADEIPLRHQPQDCQGARPHDPAIAAAAGERGDSVTVRRIHID